MEISIESRAGITSFSCGEDEKILYAGLSAGLTLPYDCATGTCGMCKARVKSGTVETIWNDAPALAKLQRDKGDILMCQSRATSNCVLRVPANVISSTAAAPRHMTGRLENGVLLTPDVMHFEVALTQPMPFDAGQFLVLTAKDVHGGRAYSMVNFAAATDRLELVIKKKPGGGLSEWMFAADRAGLTVDVFGPLGRATLRPADDHDLICIAGGSGIAGILSILEHAVAVGHFKRHTAKVYFGVRTLADGFYLDRFARLSAAAHGALDVALALSHETPMTPTHPAFPAIRLAHGFVHDVADKDLATDCAHASTFVAGPPPMVDGAIRVLIGHGVPASHIRYDKFG